MRVLVTAETAAVNVEKKRATIRYWVHKGWLKPAAVVNNTHLFDLGEVFTLETKLRYRKGGRPNGRVALQTTPNTPASRLEVLS